MCCLEKVRGVDGVKESAAAESRPSAAWRFSVVTVLLVWIASSVLHAVAAPACQFPAFLLTNSSDGEQVRDWRGRVRDQHTGTALRVTVSWGTMAVQSSDDKVASYSLNCVEVLPADDQKHVEPPQPSVKFLVQRIDNVTAPYYTCVQFVRRSPEVVQLRTTPLSARKPDVAVCHAAVDAWRLDAWIIVDVAALQVGRGRVPCALTGGFGVRMHDRAGRQGACDGRRGETWMEADCERLAGGTEFHFRHPTCIPVGLYMYATQRTFCVANWAAGAYTFSLLRHDRLPYGWLLRFPTKPEDSFTAYLLADLAADAAAESVSMTSNYIRLDVVRDVPRPATSLCLDEHSDACASWRRPCTSGPQMSLSCARTCGVCNATRPVVCSFPPNLLGSWHSGHDAGLSIDFQPSSVTLTPVSGSRLSTLRCVRWQPPTPVPTDHWRYVSDRMLVAEYSDGCRSRYVCARILQKSPSLMYFRLSAARVWPLTSSPADPIDCHTFSFDHADDTSDVDADAVWALQTNRFRLMFSLESRGVAVSCRLTGHELNNYSVTFRDSGVECSGSVFEEDSGRSLRLSLSSCTSAVNRTQYLFDCRETSRLPPPSSDLIVIVSSTPTGNATVYHCWLFPVSVGVFYLFEAAQCDAVMRGARPTLPGADPLPAVVDALTPLAVFSSKSRRSPREEDDPDEAVSPASRVHLATDVRRRKTEKNSNALSSTVPSSSSWITAASVPRRTGRASPLSSHITMAAVAITASRQFSLAHLQS